MGTTYFHWDPIDDCVIHESDDSGNTVAKYEREPGRFGPLISESRSGITHTHHYDAIGTTTALTDDTGTVSDMYNYEAWGNLTSRIGTTPTPYQFVGRTGYSLRGSTEWYGARERFYSPLASRWASPESSGNGISYQYARLSPLMIADPSGTRFAQLRFGPAATPNVNWTLKVTGASDLGDGTIGAQLRFTLSIPIAAVGERSEKRQIWAWNVGVLQGMFKNCGFKVNPTEYMWDVWGFGADLNDGQSIRTRGGNWVVSDTHTVSPPNPEGDWCIVSENTLKTVKLNGKDKEGDWWQLAPGILTSGRVIPPMRQLPPGTTRSLWDSASLPPETNFTITYNFIRLGPPCCKCFNLCWIKVPWTFEWFTVSGPDGSEVIKRDF
jgi:RHS repeat-associated protein